MNTRHSPALHQAIDAFRAPGLYLRLREHELPEDMLLLLRVAAGDSQAVEVASAISHETASAVSEAAVMFIQHLMFYPGSSSFRVLGVDRSATDARIKEHYRWLVRWLHPDRNSDEWDAVYAERVTLAWQDLRTPERRRAYEATLADVVPTSASMPAEGSEDSEEWTPSAPAPAATAPRARSVEPPAVAEIPARPGRPGWRLPAMVIAGLAACAVAVLALQSIPMQDAPVAAAEVPRGKVVAEPVAAVIDELGNSDRDYVVAAGLPAASAVSLSEPGPATAPPVAEPAAAEVPPIPVRRAPVETPIPRTMALASVPPIPPTAAPREIPAPAIRKPAPRNIAVDPKLLVAVNRSPDAAEPTPAGSVATPVQSAQAPGARMDEAAARDVIMRFRSAYASGNLNQVRSLLARNSADLDKEQAATLRTYRKLFESSTSRHMEISHPSWLADRDTAILVASFEAWIHPVGKSEERRVQGDIRFDLRSEDGEMRIVRVRHVAKGG